MEQNHSTSLTDRLERLKLAAEPGDWWHPHKPDKGDGEPQPDSIAGEVLARSVEAGSYGDRDMIKVLTPERKLWRVYIETSVLEGKFAEENPQPGDLVFAAYRGRVPKRGAQPDSNGDYDPKERYHNWDLLVDKGSAPAKTAPVTDSDVPIDGEGLREPQPAMSAAARAEETYGNDVPWDDE